eukprot:Tamp_17118.p2 GENE.Tamp_17118~~Tamp_17118.p2  ORF type:complete len:134 (-),score=19.10 Tamp_17118:874-1275(-)
MPCLCPRAVRAIRAIRAIPHHRGADCFCSHLLPASRNLLARAGWPALLAKTRSWCDGFGIYGNKIGNVPMIYLYVNEWNKSYVKCALPLHTWSCLLMSYEWQGDSGTLRLYLDGQFVTEETDLPPMRRNDAGP